MQVYIVDYKVQPPYGGLLSSSCGGLKGSSDGQTDERTTGLRELDLFVSNKVNKPGWVAPEISASRCSVCFTMTFSDAILDTIDWFFSKRKLKGVDFKNCFPVGTISVLIVAVWSNHFRAKPNHQTNSSNTPSKSIKYTFIMFLSNKPQIMSCLEIFAGMVDFFDADN